MSHHIVAMERVSFAYPDGTQALKDVSFSIHHGESVAIVGANGAGKTTLLRHLNGGLAPQSGTVRIGDLPVNRDTLGEVRRTVGMVFQDSDDQLFMPTVYEDVAFGPRNLGFPEAEVRERVIRALTQVGAEHLVDKPPYHLSGGEKKRVALATVVSMSSDILVFDEPTTGLDAQGRRQLMAVVGAFSHTRIIATHDLELVLELSNRVLILDHGAIAADGIPQQLFQDQHLLERCHLERPASLRPCPACGHGAR